MDRNEVFYDWLRAKFFDFEDNDTRVQQLSAAVTDLAEILEPQQHEVRCYTLVALDANIPLDNSRVLATYEVVKKHWNSIEGKYMEPPRGILRGVILSALYQLGSKDYELCRIIYYTAYGYSQFVPFGSEQPIINRILQEFGQDVEEEAIKEWSLAAEPTTPKIDTFKLKGFKLGSATVDQAALQTSLKKAAGVSPEGYYSYSQHPPYNNTWAANFASVASTSITEAIQSTVRDFGQSLSTESLETEINKFFNSVRTSLTKTFEESFQSLVSVERRSKLLWWKETLYSTTLKKGYREINTAVLPVVMAIDLANLLPDVTPVSVNYLLTDTYRMLMSEAPVKQTLMELLTCFEEEETQKLLTPHLPLLTDCGERATLTAFLAQIVHDQKPLKKITTYTGLRSEVDASPEQLAVIILHDLLTERIITE
jgi:hypothetical protein